MNEYHITLANDKKSNSSFLLIDLKEKINKRIELYKSDLPLVDRTIEYVDLGVCKDDFDLLGLVEKYKIDEIIISNFVNINYELLSKISSTSITSLSILFSSISVVIPKFPNIKRLLIGDNVKMDLDYSKFPQLEHLSMLSYKTFKGKIENKTDYLHELVVWYYNPKSKNLADMLSENISIKRLEVNHTNIESLEGIEQLENIEELSIAYGKNLEKIDSLLSRNKFRKVLFQNCKRLLGLEKFTEEKGYVVRKVGTNFIEITKTLDSL
jgi:hypothetical protein